MDSPQTMLEALQDISYVSTDFWQWCVTNGARLLHRWSEDALIAVENSDFKKACKAAFASQVSLASRRPPNPWSCGAVGLASQDGSMDEQRMAT